MTPSTGTRTIGPAGQAPGGRYVPQGSVSAAEEIVGGDAKEVGNFLTSSDRGALSPVSYLEIVGPVNTKDFT